MATIKDVAKLAKVNPAIVSRVINRDPQLLIKDETRKRVIAAVKELDYRPNTVARGLRMKTSKTIALFVPDNENPYFSGVVKGAQSAAAERGYTLMLFDTQEDAVKEKEYLNIIAERYVDGIILTSVYTEDETIDQIEGLNIPCVLVHRTSRNWSGLCVTADDGRGMMLAVEHLINNGHKRIAHLAGLLYTAPGIHRFEGYRKILMKNGLDFRSDYVVEANFNIEGGYSGFKKLIALKEPPTAIVAANDLTALGAMQAASDEGLIIPRDMSIIGFDDIWVSKMVTPPLTTIRYDIFEMGYRAARILIERILGENIDNQTVVMDVELVERGSVLKI